ncbi:MAG TPA: glycoside hydrolase family 38 C-terminal domain-containing protein, partial [Terriglobales bacterium]|nr:glycoside hydrolase family 38 C-terminal domain-containing protein [Terriglobales bacterium]
VLLDLHVSSDASEIVTVFSNGSVVFRGDEDMQQPVALTENAQPGQKFLVAVRVASQNVKTKISQSELRVLPAAGRPDPSVLRMEILAAQPLIAAYADGKEQRQAILETAVKSINFSALEQGNQQAFDSSLQQGQTKLQELNPWLKQFTIRAVGNSHIDMAWLWPESETVEVVRNTFQSVLDLMREYPDFKFTMSSARTYEWMQEKYPDIFAQIQQRVKEGRWEIIGGMWVEPDLNLPAGESLVRQILVGKRYFQKNFGVDVNIGWNPDSFGYNWQLPQIYKRSGMDYFVTQKLMWAHEFTTFPYKMFWWESPDGSRILTYFPHDYAEGIEAPELAKDLSTWAPQIYGPTLRDHPETMHLYGVGDHGGGPTRTMLDNADQIRKKDFVFPNLEFSTARDFFATMEKRLPELKVPTWKDELYFEYHRGVQTTQAETKRRIRRSEETMLDAEKFASIASLFGETYPQHLLGYSWKRLLFDHFHDIMPGSGIGVNYLEAWRNLDDVQRAGKQVTDSAKRTIVSRINTQGTGVPVIVFNSMSWSRNEVTEVEVQMPSAAPQVEVVDAAGKPTASQLLSMDSQTHRAHLLIQASVPSVGYATYFVRPATKAITAVRPAITATSTSLENEFVRVKIDPQTGCMTSLFDKRNNTETLAPAETDSGGPHDLICGNLLQTFVDKPKKWDAWNIDADFENQRTDLMKADEVKLVESGSMRAVLRVKQHFQNSTFVQDIIMYAGSPRVDVKMEAEWHEKHILLKVAFPLSAHNDKATFEIPYGSVQRPTTRDTMAEKAKFEVPAQRWADLSDDKHGFSLLNDCKYGYDAKGNVLRLSLLRSPEWPDPDADQGHHEFTYSLYPHAGSWMQAFTIHEGFNLNYRLTSQQTSNHQGPLPPKNSFVTVDGDNVVLTAFKRAEDDNSVIARFYEWAGKSGDITLHLPQGVQAASETNLMEKPSADLQVQAGVVKVPTKPYEIKTVKLRFGSAAPVEVIQEAK